MIAVTTLIKMIHMISSALAHHGPFPFQSFHISAPPSPPGVFRIIAQPTTVRFKDKIVHNVKAITVHVGYKRHQKISEIVRASVPLAFHNSSSLLPSFLPYAVILYRILIFVNSFF
uniref:Uncharacterized protein n=1 Tax=Siphoviridae sp. ctKNZ79 TaxID=2825440 RepID=A0A8S5U9H6_9CAUD|nr:MAG TPA: hypothetical protein [Siphoviridae sp. ctKNZ79]